MTAASGSPNQGLNPVASPTATSHDVSSGLPVPVVSGVFAPQLLTSSLSNAPLACSSHPPLPWGRGSHTSSSVLTFPTSPSDSRLRSQAVTLETSPPTSLSLSVVPSGLGVLPAEELLATRDSDSDSDTGEGSAVRASKRLRRPTLPLSGSLGAAASFGASLDTNLGSAPTASSIDPQLKLRIQKNIFVHVEVLVAAEQGKPIQQYLKKSFSYTC